ncbi:nuclear transport factor 2 family protein [Actinomycetospora sp. TBRC 11914]|uniref:nuclear transport factor 2 family protein n=1 Tax=Actinomycetospora sp. TBRC 11914 TaxID=2729387 RepID=UPI00145CC505|nr:nuclear transport factor 2 family protein [Actinomycetospora sp. TBRC 11914]NMO90943.1 nuclear transport factor 2 family protein [Actinomycetospora sp. TBRC 11914]
MSSDQGTLDAGTPAESVLESATARQFVTALRTLEERGELDDMVALSTDATRWWSVGPDDEATGPDGARQFWERYRRSFAEIGSEFSTVTETPNRVVLEWTSRGSHHNGSPVRYTGATVLELDRADTLAGVRLYYDTAATMVAAGRSSSGEGEGMLDESTTASGRNSGLSS